MSLNVNQLKTHKVFVIFLVGVLLIYCSSFFVPHDIWWDAAVFLGMGKFIYSIGSVGLWEPSRPLVWPLMLGLFWKIGLNPIIFGKILAIGFSAGIIVVTYLIGLKLFDKKTALISSLFLALFPTFFLFTNVLHTEIPSTFFSLVGIYLFLINQYKWSGFLMGIAVMTRFFQGFFVIALGIVLIFAVYKKKKKSLQNFLGFVGFLIIPSIPYLFLNGVMYKNPLFPFVLQAYMTLNTGWVFNQPWYFYFTQLFMENLLTVSTLLGIIFLIKSKSKHSTMILLLFLVGFLPYTLFSHKEMRLLIPILPIIVLLMGYGIVQIVLRIHSKKIIQKIAVTGFVVLFAFWTIPQLQFNQYDDGFYTFYEYADGIDIKESVWISNPAFITNTDLKVDELIYFPLYNSKKIEILTGRLEEVNHILINTCDILPCPPSDIACTQNHEQFLEKISNVMNSVVSEQRGQCTHHIYRS